MGFKCNSEEILISGKRHNRRVSIVKYYLRVPPNAGEDLQKRKRMAGRKAMRFLLFRANKSK